MYADYRNTMYLFNVYINKGVRNECVDPTVISIDNSGDISLYVSKFSA